MRANSKLTVGFLRAILLGIGASAISLNAYFLIQPVSYWPVGNVEWQVKLAGNGTNIPNPSVGTPLLDGSTTWGDAFQKAIDAWNEVIPDEVLTLSIVKNSAIDPGQNDSFNNVGFSGTVYGDAWGSSTAGISLSIWSGNRRIENDVLFNATKTWNAYDGNLQGETVDFLRVAKHELGHSLGLDHPDEDGQVVAAIMNSVSSDIYQLQPDDIDGISVLYGSLRWVEITVHPVDHTAPVGGTWSPSVTATGSEPITYAWEQSTDSGTTWTPVTGLPDDASSFSYTNLQMSQSGWKVRVKVNNPTAIPVVSDTATLTVTATAAAPAITLHPVGTSIGFGDSVSFIVTVSGSPTPDVQWESSSDGGTTWTNVVNGPAGSFNAMISGATTHTLYIVEADNSFNGRLFRAVATNTEGSVTSNSATLSVSDPFPVTINSQPESQIVTAGQPLSLQVFAGGSLPLAYQWRKNGANIPGATDPWFYVEVASEADAGTYAVAITNPAGTVISNNAVITVDTPLAITLQPLDTFAIVGSNPVLTVTAQGNGTLTYQWKKNGNVLMGETASTLTFSIATVLDTGNYTVDVTDPSGTITSSVAKLTVFDPIPIENRRIAAAGGYTLVVEADGTLKGAGEDTSGGMATGDDTRYFNPLTLGTGVAGVYATSSSLRVNLDGTLWVTGWNSNGQLGVEPWGFGVMRTSWIQIATGVATAASGGNTNYFLKQDGTLWAMGSNEYGKMGLPAVDQTTTPVLVASGVKAVSTGGTSSAFIKVDGTLWAMGLNQSGQIGVDTGGGIFVSSPLHVADDVVAVSVGATHMLFLKANGEMWATGGNSSGQLGDGTTTNRTTPVKVADGVAKISAGDNYSLFVKTDGSMWATGWNAEGQLGLGDYVNRTTPGLVAEGVTAIAAGGWHSVFLKGNEPWGMGRNIEGTLGDGTQVGKNAAVRIFLPASTPQAPFITTHPAAQQIVSAGQAVQFSVVASGDAPLSYQWKKGGAEILGATSATYQIAVVQLSDAGTYTVVVTNGAGSATSNGAVLTVNPALTAPSITQHPTAKLSVVVGQQASFSVTATGTAPLAYQWRKGGANIGGATASTYTFVTSDITGDTGSYDVVVTNPVGSATSTATALTVTASAVAPTVAPLTTDPNPPTITEGQSVTFTADASGTSPLSYQWRKGGVNISGATSASYGITNAQVSNAGDYDVVVTNAQGSATSNTVSLVVNLGPPMITITYPIDGDAIPVDDDERLYIPVRVDASGDVGQIQSVVVTNAVLTMAGPPRWEFERSARVEPGTSETITFKATATLADSSELESNQVTVVVYFDCFVEGLDRLARFLSTRSSSAKSTGSKVATMLAAVAGLDLDLFRRFRDEVLLDTPAGRYFADLYRLRSRDMIGAMIGNPAFILEVHQALLDWTPAIQALVDGQGASVTITPAMQAQAQAILSQLRILATGELATSMDAETAALDPATWSGLTIGQLLGRVEAQTRPPPAISAQPIAKTVVIGSDATFSVQPTGAGPFTYQWRRNGANISGATNATFTVSDVQPGGGGNYSVVVSNPFGSTTSSAATLALDTTPRLINVSCLASAGVGDATLVAGFFIKGSGSKELLIRGIGPRLTSDPFNRTGVVADPQISVYDKDGVLIASNDDWDPILAADFSRMGAFGLTVGSKDAALKLTLPGNDRYTVHLVNTGPVADGLIEVYDLSRDLPTRLSNVSCRIAMKAGETVILGTSLIANPVPVLASAVGPGLANYGIPIADVLPDPDVRIYGGSTEIAFNEDWNSSLEPYFGPAGAFPLTAGSKDAVARVTFSQGGLTIHATGKGQSGVAIIQLFESPEPP